MHSRYYENSTLSTAKWISNDYDDGVMDHGLRSYINDTVSFELASNKSTKGVPNFQVGTLDTFYASFVLPAPQAGFSGLSRPCDLLRSTLVEIGSGYHASFINQLYERSIIPGRTISVYIGQDVPDIDNAMLLINDKDAAKKASTTSTVPMDTSQ